MASTSSTQGQEGSSGSQPRIALERIAKENTFDVEWSELQRHIQEALRATIPIFLSLGPPRNRQSAPSPTERPAYLASSTSDIGRTTPDQEMAATSPPASTSTSTSGSGSITKSDDSEKTPSPVSSKTPSPVSQARQHIQSEDGSGSSPLIGPTQPVNEELEDDLRPSTQGGLVIAPFPPLDPNRRKRGNSVSSGSGSGPQVVSIAPRPNGLGHPTPPIRITSGNVFDDEWDEDVVIGGKKLPGWMDDQEGKQEVNRLVKMVEQMDEPPFTLQRLAELLVQPSRHHKTLGKFLRAVEKTLLVSTPWEAPSYTYVPGTTFPAPESSLTSMDSTMPPGMGTPKFSPIPFLRRPSSSPETEMNGDGNGSGLSVPGGQVEDSMMSPLILGEGGSNVTEEYRLDESPNSARSPTPEPEESNDSNTNKDVDVEMSTNTNNNTDTTPPNVTTDPSNQPYLGRVDELDTGPIQARSAVEDQKDGNGRKGDAMAPGTGESGGLTPHGMSERPVPISSTTVIADDERKIASLPSSSTGTDTQAITEEKKKEAN